MSLRTVESRCRRCGSCNVAMDTDTQEIICIDCERDIADRNKEVAWFDRADNEYRR